LERRGYRRKKLDPMTKPSFVRSTSDPNGGEKMLNKKLAILTLVVMIAPLVLGACGPTPEPVVIRETSVVVETVVVEKEGETVVEEATRIVEVEKVVTATPEPEPTEPPMAAVAPEFKNEDTYVVVQGAGEPETLDPSWTYETAGSGIENNSTRASSGSRRTGPTSSWACWPATGASTMRVTSGPLTSATASCSTRAAR
jgi:hypothetical protein